MGVPKFYRWISERYPKINQIITDTALLPEFDHLYLDMNGIIHGCTHPQHLDSSVTLTEKEMMVNIMNYIDRIVTQIVKPKVSLYMAIDGVAPRAKLNQQRSRRFRSAKDMREQQEEEEAKKNERGSTTVVNGESQNEKEKKDIFDSNCITPGTEFMFKVSECIKFFIRKKIKTDPVWKNLRVIFSGHEIPGEGEHKIMEFIREMKSMPGYKPNNRHCMYGQDADLIMLGLVTHEPHFVLLREVVDFSFSRSSKNSLKVVKKWTKQSDFQLLHLSILREYLFIEFVLQHKPIVSSLEEEKEEANQSPGTDLAQQMQQYESNNQNFNLENLIDDFVFLTFLVGNDFLPHLPSLDISENAFDLLFHLYKTHRQNWISEGSSYPYLTKSGEIPNPERLEKLLAEIGVLEDEILKQREVNDAKYLEKKKKWDKRDGVANTGPSDEELALIEQEKQKKYNEILQQATGTTTAEKDFRGRYYFEKLEFLPPLSSNPKLYELCKAYIEGLIWCLAYYYKGCIDWEWFYPYHYGPMLSDVKDLTRMFSEIKFSLGSPLLPFQQLMSCLPPQSAELVPKIYRHLMCSVDSPIKKFYPDEFEVDMNGKKNPWEGVNLLPFLNVKELKLAIEKHCPNSKLSPKELERNCFGRIFVYEFDLTCQETLPSFNKQIVPQDLVKCHSKVLEEDFSLELKSVFEPKLVDGTQIPYPGYPSLKVLPISKTESEKLGVNVFGFASKYKTCTLALHELPELPSAVDLCQQSQILGRSLYINWPMMHEAKVVAVSDEICEVRLVDSKKAGKKKKGNSNANTSNFIIKKFTKEQSQQWQSENEVLKHQYLMGNSTPGSGGVHLGSSIPIRFQLAPLQGMKTSLKDGSTSKVFGKEKADVPIQMVLFNAPAPDPRFVPRKPMKLSERFPVESNVVLTKGKYRGFMGTVLGVADEKKQKIGIKVQVTPPEPPFGFAIAKAITDNYISSSDAARVLKISPQILGRLMSSIYFDPGRYDLGLNLKYNAGRDNEEMCVLGYARRKNIGTKKNNGSNNKGENAWQTGDSLLVVGSSSISSNSNDKSNGGGGDGKPVWEYTPQAIRLLASYRNKFPQLFAYLQKYPNEKFYQAKKVFGREDILPEIREWLNNIETAKIPRTPTDTSSLPIAAIKAVQRASDVRLSSLKPDDIKETNIKVPSTAIFLQNSISPTDVVHADDYNDGSPPQLGCRVVNLCAPGIPFGLKGTVVTIHKASSGCVEIVLDEEIMGGSNLQGTCDMYRGKLVCWNHLLRVSAIDTEKSIVNSAAENKSSDISPLRNNPQEILKTPTPPEGERVKNRTNNTPSRSNTTPLKAPNSSSSISAPRSSSNVKSTNKVLWKEALGPSYENGGTGFSKNAKRASKSGYKAWKKLVSSTTATEKNKTNQSSKSTFGSFSADLKAVLGVSNNDPTSSMPTTGTNSVDDATLALKAKLGINNMVPNVNVPAPKPSLIPLNSIPMPPPPQQQQMEPQSETKALLQKMMNISPVLPAQPVPQQAPAFNFTYVKEGEKAEENHPSNTLHLSTTAPMQHFAVPVPPPPVPMVGFFPPPVMPYAQPVPSPVKTDDTVIPRKKKGGGSIVPSSVKQRTEK